MGITPTTIQSSGSRQPPSLFTTAGRSAGRRSDYLIVGGSVGSMKTELTIPSDLKFMPIVENWLLESLKIALEHGNEEQWRNLEQRLRLVVVEVYSNVVRHAHQNQPELPILMKVELEQHNLFMEVWDQGNGFNLESYSPPAPEDKQEGGYGWLILHRIMDQVEYHLHINGSGNCLKMSKSLND